MEKNRKKALRRNNNWRMQHRAIKMLNDWDWFGNTEDLKERHEIARRYRDNMCYCSCSGCGNPRNHPWAGRRDRMTMPEIKAEDSYLDAMEEYLTVDPKEKEE